MASYKEEVMVVGSFYSSQKVLFLELSSSLAFFWMPKQLYTYPRSVTECNFRIIRNRAILDHDHDHDKRVQNYDDAISFLRSSDVFFLQIDAVDAFP